MGKRSTINIAVWAGVFALIVGIIAFALNWMVWGGGMPGYSVFLFPGNLSLVYLWHPLFTEEIGFWLKLFLQLLGQFFIVSAVAALITNLARRGQRVGRS